MATRASRSIAAGWPSCSTRRGRPASGVRRSSGMDDGPRVLIGLALADRLDGLLQADASGLEPLDELQAGLGMALPVVRRLMGLEGGTILSAREGQALGLRLTLPLVTPQTSEAASETAV